MLVKHNLSTITGIEFIEKFWPASGQYLYKKETDVFSFWGNKAIEVNSYAGFGYDYNYEDNIKFVSFSLENLGEYDIKVGFHLNPIPPITIKAKETKKFKIDLELMREKKSNYFYFGPTNISDAYEVHKFKINKIIATHEDSDVYLPNINTLPQDKQPLLPPEGHYKEIQSL